MREKYALYEIDDAVLGASEKERSQMDMPFRKRNLRILFGITIGVFGIFFARVGYLSVIQGEYYAQVSQENALRVVPIEAPRGKIFDRKGFQLVYNVPSTNVVFRFSQEGREVSKDVYTPLQEFFSLSEEEFSFAYEEALKGNVSEVLLKENITQEEALGFSERERSFPGVVLKKSIRRQYEESAIFSHVIGYENALNKDDREKYPEYLLTDSVGRRGLEKSYEEELKGVHGAKRVEVDALGKIRREISSQDPQPGHNLILSIDAHLQKTLFDAMQEELDKNDLSRGAGVAIDPRDGSVLALVSFPSYDNNIFSERNNTLYGIISQDENQPLFNRVISGEYPPASTIKPMISVAALTEGIISPDKAIESRGGISVGSTFFGDWKAHGFTDMRRAIAVSSDVYFYSIGGGYGGVSGLGMETMARYDKLFGFSKKTGIDLSGESAGLVPTPQWKEEVIGERWYVGNTYHASIGQGYLRTTPLQVALATSIIANGGTVFEPKIVSFVESSEGTLVKRIPHEGTKLDIQEDFFQVAREGMRQTITEGTALSLNDLSVEVAGKTGTAEYGPKDKTHGWFTSFAPYESPEIVLTVLFEGQENDGYHAVPVTKKVYEAYFSSSEEKEE